MGDRQNPLPVAWRCQRWRGGARHSAEEPIANGRNLDFLPHRRYVLDMSQRAENMIVPKDFPELNTLAWNRDPARPIEREIALALYERNWRFVNARDLAPREAALLRDLIAEFGRGHLLTAR